MLPVVVALAAVFFVVAPLVVAAVSAVRQPTHPGQARAADGQAGQPTESTTPTGRPTRSPAPADTHPDDPPVPSTYAEVYQTLESSPLYDQALPPTQCSLTDIDLATASVPAVEEHLNGFVDCLMAVWSGPVADAGFELPRPSVTVYTAAITSPCGELDMTNAAYCTADQQIYYADDLVEIFPSDLWTMRFTTESVLAHEFGHEIQYRTMILTSAAVLAADASTDDQMDLSRRTEMQADCFAGVFLNSVSGSVGMTTQERQRIVTLFTDLGGTTPYEDDHGTGAHRAAWVTKGLASTTPGVCSTYTAPADSVG